MSWWARRSRPREPDPVIRSRKFSSNMFQGTAANAYYFDLVSFRYDDLYEKEMCVIFQARTKKASLDKLFFLAVRKYR